MLQCVKYFFYLIKHVEVLVKDTWQTQQQKQTTFLRVSIYVLFLSDDSDVVFRA